MHRIEAVEPVTVPRAEPAPACAPKAGPNGKRLRTGIRAGWVAYTDDGTT